MQPQPSFYNILMPETETIRLTTTVKAGGCAAKLSPAALDKVLGKLPRQHDPNVLVGFDHADDAGVYQLGPDSALVQTVDFFTPIVDDPYTFGQIAATNALSDIYAMGGRPITALAMVCFPEKGDLEILERILAGGLSKMIEAGCVVIGGHSIRDDETKFGYAVTGLIDPKKVLKNGGAQPGDLILFTKSLGTGTISTAIKKGVAKQPWIAAAIASMTTLNKTAAEVITQFQEKCRLPHPSRFSKGGDSAHDRRPFLARPELSEGTDDAFQIHALTDVTGFGLIGHAREMALASDNVSLHFHADRIPLLEGALSCIRAGHISGGLKANREFAECVVEYEDGIPEELKTILFDPQTAGGLLISAAASAVDDLTRALTAAGVPAVEIGEVLPRTKVLIAVAP
jgi:selenide,water dikinase